MEIGYITKAHQTIMPLSGSANSKLNIKRVLDHLKSTP